MSIVEQVKKEARRHVLWHFGNLVSVEEPIRDKKEELWKVELKTDYPRIIKNDSPEERFVKTLRIRNLGTLYLNDKLAVVKSLSTPRARTVEYLKTRLRTWEERAENIIVEASALQLANTGTAQVFLHPIKTILANFLEEKGAIITVDGLDRLRKTERYLQWIRLLEELDLVRKEDEGYSHGNIFTELRRQSNDDQTFLTAVIAYVIRERYSVLKEVFNLRQLETLVHLDGCYYRPAMEARRILRQKAESLYSRYIANYRYRSRIELPAILLELCRSQAICREGKYYLANTELFDRMIQMTEGAISISTPYG